MTVAYLAAERVGSAKVTRVTELPVSRPTLHVVHGRTTPAEFTAGVPAELS